MSKATYSLRLRSYKDKAFVTLWLVRRDGQVHSALMWGELLPQAAEEIVAALGMPVERIDLELDQTRPLQPLGCISVAEQRSLFEEHP